MANEESRSFAGRANILLASARFQSRGGSLGYTPDTGIRIVLSHLPQDSYLADIVKALMRRNGGYAHDGDLVSQHFLEALHDLPDLLRARLYGNGVASAASNCSRYFAVCRISAMTFRPP
jgi:hypothetical protein